jgi:hypothetical protein
VKYTAAKHLDIGASEGKLPDIPWLLQVLAIFCPEHKVFQKDYLPPLPVAKKEDLVIDNADGFYTGLQALYKPRDLKRISKLMSYRHGGIESKVKKLKERKAEMEMKIALLGEKLKAGSQPEMIKVSKETFALMERQLKDAGAGKISVKGKTKTPLKATK